MSSFSLHFNPLAHAGPKFSHPAVLKGAGQHYNMLVIREALAQHKNTHYFHTLQYFTSITDPITTLVGNRTATG